LLWFKSFLLFEVYAIQTQYDYFNVYLYVIYTARVFQFPVFFLGIRGLLKGTYSSAPPI